MAVRAILTAGSAVPVHALPDAGDVRVTAREADEAPIAAAVERLLENDAVRTSARRFADVIATYRNGAPAVAELERLAASS